MLDPCWTDVVGGGPTLVQHTHNQQHTHNIGIQMKRKERTETSMMISNCKRPFSLHGLYNNITALQGLMFMGARRFEKYAMWH